MSGIEKKLNDDVLRLIAKAKKELALECILSFLVTVREWQEVIKCKDFTQAIRLKIQIKAICRQIKEVDQFISQTAFKLLQKQLNYEHQSAIDFEKQYAVMEIHKLSFLLSRMKNKENCISELEESGKSDNHWNYKTLKAFRPIKFDYETQRYLMRHGKDGNKKAWVPSDIIESINYLQKEARKLNTNDEMARRALSMRRHHEAYLSASQRSKDTETDSDSDTDTATGAAAASGMGASLKPSVRKPKP